MHSASINNDSIESNISTETSTSGIVPYTTVAGYAEYMDGDHDKDSSIKHNPPPTDGMTLADLGKLSKSEILEIVNEMGKCPNKSDIRVMYSHGYSFSWTELRTVADFLGFVLKNPGTNTPQYSMDCNAEPKDEYESSLKVIKIPHGRVASKAKHITLSLQTWELKDKVFGNMPNQVQSKAFDKAIYGMLMKLLDLKTADDFHVEYIEKHEIYK